MGLETRIEQDLKDAMRAKDEPRKRTLRLLRAALKNASIEAGGPLDEAGVTAVLQKQAKQRRDAIGEFEKGGREDLAAGEREELAILEGYLPEMMDADEVEAVAREAIAQVGAEGPGDMGSVMGPLMGRLQGRADGRLVSDTVRRLLAG